MRRSFLDKLGWRPSSRPEAPPVDWRPARRLDARRIPPDVVDPLAAVALHLELILNVKKGHGSFLLDLGLGSPGSDAPRTQREALQFEMRETIVTYEPALACPMLAYTGSVEMWFFFTLSATCAGQPRELALYYHVVTGRVRVEVVA